MSDKKRGQLNDVEKYFISGNHQSISVDEISKKLNRSKQQIKRFISSITKKVEKPKPLPVKEEDKVNVSPKQRASHVDSLMGKRERKGEVVATVMTPAASQYNDEVKKSTKSSQLNKFKSCIHQPKGKK